MRFGHRSLWHIYTSHAKTWQANHEDVSMREEATYSLPHESQHKVNKKKKQKKQLDDVKLGIEFHII